MTEPAPPKVKPEAPLQDVAKGQTPPATPKPKETGGPSGPEPTRYGDWERGGRCIDF